MTKFLMMTVAFTVLSASAVVADDAKVSFTFDVGPVKVSITGVSQGALHDDQTKKMLKRAAQLAHYSVLQLRQQQDFPQCLEREERNISETGVLGRLAELDAPCLRWEQ